MYFLISLDYYKYYIESLFLFFVCTPHFTSAYGGGGGGGGGGSILLTLIYGYYNDVELAPNVITCYDILLTINEF